jgi:hypothetical protein
MFSLGGTKVSVSFIFQSRPSGNFSQQLLSLFLFFSHYSKMGSGTYDGDNEAHSFSGPLWARLTGRIPLSHPVETKHRTPKEAQEFDQQVRHLHTVLTREMKNPNTYVTGSLGLHQYIAPREAWKLKNDIEVAVTQDEDGKTFPTRAKAVCDSLMGHFSIVHYLAQTDRALPGLDHITSKATCVLPITTTHLLAPRLHIMHTQATLATHMAHAAFPSVVAYRADAPHMFAMPRGVHKNLVRRKWMGHASEETRSKYEPRGFGS